MCSSKLLSVFMLAVCLGAQVPAKPSDVKSDKDNYTIGAGDEISVHVVDSQDIPEKPVRVDPDGQIALPLIGRVTAAGQSVSALETEITRRLRTYIISPQVSVNVTDSASRPISVLGAVNAPGIYQLGGAKSLAQVIALAKGLSADAGGRIRITRYEPGNKDLDPTKSTVTQVSVKDLLSSAGTVGSIPIQANDVITVPKAALVYVIGEVVKPGAQPLTDRDSITVLEAISAAQGTLPVGSPQHAKLLRRDPQSGVRTEMALNVKRIMSGKGENLLLQPDDILLIPRNDLRAVGLKSVDAAISLGTGALIYR